MDRHGRGATVLDRVIAHRPTLELFGLRGRMRVHLPYTGLRCTDTMRSLTVLGAGLVVAFLAGCSATASSAPAPGGESLSAGGSGLSSVAPADPLTVPEAEPGRTIDVTVDAEPGASLRLPRGYTVALVRVEGEKSGATLADGIRAALKGKDAIVTEFTAAPGADGVIDAVSDALLSAPDLVIGAGEGTVDGLSYVTAENLQTQFLVLGGQLPEPTANVTAVVWPGASSRGSAVAPDPEAATEITVSTGEIATEIGVSSVIDGTTGVVLALKA